MSGLWFVNNKHTIAKVRENVNRHGGENATITKWRHWWQLVKMKKHARASYTGWFNKNRTLYI